METVTTWVTTEQAAACASLYPPVASQMGRSPQAALCVNIWGVWDVRHLSRDPVGSLGMAEAKKGEAQTVCSGDGHCLVLGRMNHAVNRTRLVNRAPAGINLARWGCSPGAAGHGVRALSRGDGEKGAE